MELEATRLRDCWAGHGAWTFYMARMCDMHIVAWLEHHLKEINN